MQTEALSTRRLTSTLTIALVPIVLGVLIYSYWLYQYFYHYELFPLEGKIQTIGFALLVITVPANFLGLLFLFIPWSKNKEEIKQNASLKKKYTSLLILLLANYAIGAGIIYNYNWLTKTISLEFQNDYPERLRDLVIVLPNGDAVHLDKVEQGSTLVARVMQKGEGPIGLIAEDAEGIKVREVIIPKPPKGMGGRVKIRLTPEFTLKKLR
ncbi:MAG: hypothetical protein ACJAT2_000088 [Bacteriovoracaceae bacterium]|jgi:hypothetical protein